MAFYQEVKPRKVSRQEHMKKEWSEAEEGSRYHPGEKGGAGQRPSGYQGGYRADNRGGANQRPSGYQGAHHTDNRGGTNERPSGYQGGYRADNRGGANQRPSGYQGGYRADNRNGVNQRPSGYQGGYRADNRGGVNQRPSGYQGGYRADNRGNVTRPAPAYQGQARPMGQAPRGNFNETPRRPFDRTPAHFDAPRVAPVAPKPVAAPEQDTFDTPYTKEPENLLSGRNPIREALKSGRDIEKLLVAKGELSGSAREIVAMAREKRIPVQVVERSRLDEITHNHQGMLAFASAYQYSDVDSMFALAKEREEKPFLIILDGVTDPHNLGAVIRTAACVGAHGVIVPERRAVGLTPAAVKASAGAVETIKVARVTNLTRTIETLKKEGLWIYAADMEGTDYRQVKMETPMALVVGSEGEGISRLVLEQADYKVKLPMYGGVQSLNASVAAGILMYAAVSSRE